MTIISFNSCIVSPQICRHFDLDLTLYAFAFLQHIDDRVQTEVEKRLLENRIIGYLAEVLL